MNTKKIIIIAVVLLVIGVAAYFFFKNKKEKEEQKTIINGKNADELVNLSSQKPMVSVGTKGSLSNPEVISTTKASPSMVINNAGNSTPVKTAQPQPLAASLPVTGGFKGMNTTAEPTRATASINTGAGSMMFNPTKTNATQLTPVFSETRTNATKLVSNSKFSR